MSTPVRHAVAVAALTALVATALYAFGQAVAPVYPMATARAALLESAAPHVEAVTLGSSHNHAIDFEALGTEGFHLWRNGGDLAEARHTLAAFRGSLPALRLVLLPVSGFHHDNASVGGPRAQIRYEMYAETGGLRTIPGDWRSLVRARVAPIARPDHWAGVLLAIAGREAPETSAEIDGWPSWVSRDVTTPHPDSLLAHAEARGRDHAATEAATLASKPDACAIARGDLEALAGIAESAAVVLYTPPYHPAYSRWSEEESECRLRAVADSLADALPNVFYFEYDEKAPFFREAVHLRDESHLNLLGARAFSAELRRRLVEEGVLGWPGPLRERP